MALFSIQNGSAKKIPHTNISIERNIQKIFENNLNEILDVTFLASEHSTSFGGRIDTLGIDNNGSPVIIEYKRSQNNNVINQGLSYLRWLLDHKADFESLVIKKLSNLYNAHILNFNGDQTNVFIDWSSPRVVCIAESYNKFDLDTADLLPINIELLKFRVYQDGILLVEPETHQKVKISTSNVFEKGKNEKSIKEKIIYSMNDHFSGVNPKIKKIFEEINEKIVALDESIIVQPKAKYIAYKLATNFVDVVIMKTSLKLFLNLPSGELNDPKGIARDLSKPKKIGHLGNGDYEVKLEDMERIDEVFELIKQSYSYSK